MINVLSSDHPTNFNQVLYSAQQTREIDRLAITQLHSGDGYELMKKAGRALFQLVRQTYIETSHWLVFCGRGNNGGDGYVAAMLAASQNINVTIVQVGSTSDLLVTLQGEALTAYQELMAFNADAQTPVQIIELLDFMSDVDTSEIIDTDYLVVDAMLGTGLSGEVRGDYLKAISWINRLHVPIIAVDIPSGLSSDTGQVLGCAVHATMTLTFIGINQGLVTGQAKNHTGTLYYDELGVPEEIKHQIESNYVLLSQQTIDKKLFKRKPTDHKGTSGRGLFIGGSNGTSGAAILACEACLKSGIGLLSAMVGENAVGPMLSRCPEVMVRNFEEQLIDQVRQLASGVDALAVGPGLGQSDEALTLLKEVLLLQKPTLIDADALNLISKHPDLWGQYGHQDCILTPHPFEAARLLNLSVSEIEQNRYQACERLIEQYNCCVLLKGSGTLISKKQNNLSVSYFGNEAMATGGMGDVLSGIILALLAKSKNCIESTKFGAFIHGMAGERASDEGIVGCLPSDVINQIKLIINETL